MPAGVPRPIAFCITELDRGGAERALTQLVLGLDRREWEPRVYCLGPPGEYGTVLADGGIPVECFHAGGLHSLPRVLWQLTRALRRFRPVLLQTFLFHGNLIGRVAARLAGVRHVVSGIRVAERRTPWHGRWERWTDFLVTHTVCVSQGVADFAVRETRLSPDKLSVIPNGVDPAFLASAPPADVTPWGLRPGDPVVITVARLEPQKGLDDLLEAIPHVLERFPACQFLIVGEGFDGDRLRSLAVERGIGDAVWFPGRRTDVDSLLKASTLFVLPSRWEGMSNALLEAMATPLPVIATAVEGTREVVTHEHNGLLVSPDNPLELAVAITRLLDNTALRHRLAHSAQETIQTRFTTQKVIQNYTRLYLQILDPSTSTAT